MTSAPIRVRPAPDESTFDGTFVAGEISPPTGRAHVWFAGFGQTAGQLERHGGSPFIAEIWLPSGQWPRCSLQTRPQPPGANSTSDTLVAVRYAPPDPGDVPMLALVDIRHLGPDDRLYALYDEVRGMHLGYLLVRRRCLIWYLSHPRTAQETPSRLNLTVRADAQGIRGLYSRIVQDRIM